MFLSVKMKYKISCRGHNKCGPLLNRPTFLYSLSSCGAWLRKKVSIFAKIVLGVSSRRGGGPSNPPNPLRGGWVGGGELVLSVSPSMPSNALLPSSAQLTEPPEGHKTTPNNQAPRFSLEQGIFFALRTIILATKHPSAPPRVPKFAPNNPAPCSVIGGGVSAKL